MSDVVVVESNSNNLVIVETETHCVFAGASQGPTGDTGPMGEVTGAVSSTTGNFASFADATGKALADSGYSAASFATAARTISAGTGLTGGGDLSQNRTIGLDSNSSAALNLAASALQPGANASTLTNDTGWDTGNVDGPTSSTDNNLVAFDGVTGKLIKDSGISTSGIVANTRQVNAGTGLTGGGDLSANRTISLDSNSTASLAKADSALQMENVGNDVQAHSDALDSIAGLTTAANKLPYTTAEDTYGLTDFTAFARTLLDDTDAEAARATIGVDGIYSLEDTVTNGYVPLKQAGGFVDSTIAIDGNGAATFGGNGPTTFNHDVDVTGTVTVIGQSNTGNIRIDGNSISTTDTDGNLTLAPDGAGTVEVSADTNVTGAITATDDSAIGKTVTSGVRLDIEGDGILAARFKNTDTTNGFGVKINAGGSAAGRYALLVANVADDTNYVRVSTETGNVGKLEALAGLDVTGAISATTGVTPATSQDAITAWKNRTAYTPTVSGSGGSAGSFAATTTVGEYIRIGDFCIAKIRLDTITDKGSWTGDVRFSLPFAAVSNGSVFGGGTIETMEQHSFTGQLSAFALNGQSYARIRTFSSAGTPGYLQWSDLTAAAGNDIAFTVIYTVA
jgi:hypothetical protein